MMRPTIHRNGTSWEALFAQATDAGSAVYAAITACEQASPNARDYYLQAAGAYAAAVAEHRSRIERLESVLREFNLLAEAIADAE